ncbi:hypothetical protein ACFLUS_01060 [Chloroflexota bacterium]
MNKKDFVMNYLWPSEDKLDRTFTYPLPDIKGLKKYANYIVQCEHEDTFSTNIITKYVSDTLGVNLRELYKNTQNRVTGVFVRLVGTMSIVKMGYPRLSVDVAVTNVNLITAERGDVTTGVKVHLPQADPEQRKVFFYHLSERAKEQGISYREMQSKKQGISHEVRPDYWGPVWSTESKGVDIGMARHLRDYAWNSYKRVIEQTKEKIPFDYMTLKEHMIFNRSKQEYLMFERVGLSVPVEAQAAFFSMQVSEL